MESDLEILSEQSCFGGTQGFYRHSSTATGTDMQFAVFLPPQAETGAVPVLYFLAGLTCTEETATIKAGAQRHAAERGLMLVMPDTSPRGAGIAGEDDDWDLGTGAGFYLDATTEPWSAHYRMRSYIVDELRCLVNDRFPARVDATGIFGHSMGGHGALTLALSHPQIYRSVSAFAPICSPIRCPWGTKALGSYLASKATPGVPTTPPSWSGRAADKARSSSTRAIRISSWLSSSTPAFFQPPAPTPVRRSNCGCNRATTTATTLSRHSWVITSRTTRAGSSEAAQGRTWVPPIRRHVSSR
jgi:S-formylglutathione hydrolase